MRPGVPHTYTRPTTTSWPIPNQWDWVALILVLGVITGLGIATRAMGGHFQWGETVTLSLDPVHLPYYALRTVTRLLGALVCSLLFTFIFGAWAAKSRVAERVIIPIIDILQSVPILGFLTIAVVWFVTLFRGSLLGPECAAMFVIFTSQVWNMTLSFYQSLKMVPSELHEAAAIFQLSALTTFWRIEVPFAMPSLIWNMMISMSGSWVFLVASEAILVAGQQIYLPGVGSYIGMAILYSDVHAILYAIVTMVIVIAIYDQLLFRVLVAWSEKFKMEASASEDLAESWVLNLFQRTALLRDVGEYFAHLWERFVYCSWFRQIRLSTREVMVTDWQRWIGYTGYVVFCACVLVALWLLLHFVFGTVTWHEVREVIFLGFVTAVRVIILVAVCSVLWVPLAIRIGLHPRASQWAQPIVQFLAAFPANLLFPLVVMVILRYHLNVNIWVSPLMILGAQWYIVFNVIAGAQTIPKNWHYAVNTLQVRGWLWWRRFILPGVFPYYITGAITAAGGTWNMSIIAEARS